MTRLRAAFVTLSFLTALLDPSAGPLYARTLDTCFSPHGHCDQVLISWINASARTLDGAIYGLTDPDIADAFIRAHRRGVRVRLVHDKSMSSSRNSAGRRLAAAGIPVRVRRGSRGGIQHNKFLVIDGQYVLTGSFNWTRNAARKNDENFVILDDQAAKFGGEFERLWNRPMDPSRRSRRSRRLS